MERSPWIFSCAMIGVLAGCSDPPRRDPFGGTGVPPGLGSGAPDDDEGDEDEGGEEMSGGTGGADEGSGSDDSGAPPADTPAGGIAIVGVEANQGVAVALADAGAPVPLAQRNAELIHGRATLVRAMWAVAPGFSPRTIEGRLTLARPDGTTEVLTDARMVSGDSDPDSATSTMSWVLEPEQVVPGLTYSVELFETSGRQPELEPAGAFPATGAGDFGIDGTQMRMRVVAIPVTTPGGGVIVNDALKQAFADRLLATYPVQSVEVTWRAPWNRTSILTQESEAWDYMIEARAQDGAGASYYHLLLDPDTCCDDTQGQFTWGGLGDLIDEELLSYGYYGDAMSMIYPGDYELAMDVVIHEIGHNHGREHAPCGDPGGPDPAFPYPNAGLGTRGWDSGRDELIIPAFDPLTGGSWSDFMSYCWPNWWSDYSWRALTTRVERMSGMQDQAPPPWDGLELRAYVSDDGTAQWRLLPAPFRAPPAAPGSEHVRLLAADGHVVATLPVVTSRPGDSTTRIVRTNVSTTPTFDRLELHLTDLDLAAPRSAVRLSTATP